MRDNESNALALRLHNILTALGGDPHRLGDEQVDARKVRLQKKEAFELAGQVNEIYATRGKKVIHINLKKDLPDEATLTKLLIGPSGNLRAPTLRKGKTLIVGFDEETYEKLLR